MKQKKVLPIIISLTLGIALSIGISYATSTWTAPTQTAPSANLPIPVHAIVNGDQIKDGGLGVYKFIANKDAQFAQELFLAGIIHGGAYGDTNTTIKVGGKDTSGVSHNVTVNVDGNVSATDYIRSTPLSNNPGGENVCATPNGMLVLCSSASGGGTSAVYSFRLDNPNPCNGIYSDYTLSGAKGDSVALRMSFGGQLQYNNVESQRSAAMSFTVASTTASDNTQTWTYPQDGTTNGFNLSKTITFTMPSDSVKIYAQAVTNNSTEAMSAASFRVVTVNGVSNNASTSVCVGNSQGG